MADFKWAKTNLASVATYNILAGNPLGPQIYQNSLLFDAASSTKMGTLPYYPKYGAPGWFISGRADDYGRRFYKGIIDSYTRHKEDPKDSVEAIIQAFIDVFAEPSKTIGDLAATADKFFRFTGEQ
jgi:hypothetical protein